MGCSPYQRPSRSSLTVSRSTGALTFKGGGLCIEGGLSGSTAPARNLRGKNVKVKAGATSTTVAFPAAEADADYAAFVETSWLADRAVAKKAASGFAVQFARPAPDAATLDWMIVRWGRTQPWSVPGNEFTPRASRPARQWQDWPSVPRPLPGR